MEENIYAELEKSIEDMVNDTIQTKNLSLTTHLPKIEAAFIKAGFRDEPAAGGVQNILLVKIDNVGDFILSSAAIREFRKNFPAANITLVVSRNIFQVAERCPYVNEVLPFDMPVDLTSVEELLKTTAVFCRNNLWKRRFDLALDLRYFKHAKVHHLFMCYFSGARERKGYIFGVEDMYTDPESVTQQNFSHFMHTQLCLHPKEFVADYQRNLFLLTAFGWKVEDSSLELWYDAEDKFKAKKLLEGFAPGKIKIIVGIGASGSVRKYPVEKYLEAFKKIVEKDAAFILLGGPTDIEEAKFLQENLPAESVLNLVGKSGGWRVDSAIVKQSDLYIGNDAGTMHLASASGVPIIYLSRVAKDRKKHFPDQPTECEIYVPQQAKYILLQPEHQLEPCATTPHFAGCNANIAHCITQIDPEEIVSAFDEMKKFLQSKSEE